MSEKDIDPQETIEWLEAFRSVARFEGKDRAKYILQKLMDMACLLYTSPSPRD